MIYVRLHGGLGNQLFQYAVGRALALRRSVELALDPRDALKKRAIFHPALHHFAIVHAGEVPLPPSRERHFAYAFWRYAGLRPRILRERDLGFDPAVLEAPDDTYLHGYFQSEKYFSAHSDDVRKDLRIVTPPSDENARVLAEIAEDAFPISLHVRRGDYISQPKGNRVHGTCGPRYYQMALDEILTRADGEPKVYVFSDDPPWASENLDIPCQRVVLGHNGPEQHYEDLRLMSACRAHVIANSTFSWWGAWLNARQDKVVVAPSRWFSDHTHRNPDIIPESWLRISV